MSGKPCWRRRSENRLSVYRSRGAVRRHPTLRFEVSMQADVARAVRSTLITSKENDLVYNHDDNDDNDDGLLARKTVRAEGQGRWKGSRRTGHDRVGKDSADPFTSHCHRLLLFDFK